MYCKTYSLPPIHIKRLIDHDHICLYPVAGRECGNQRSAFRVWYGKWTVSGFRA